MAARFRSGWWHIKQHPYTTVIVVVVIALILFILCAYRFGWDWTGLTSGTSQITITSTSKGNYTATLLQPSKSLWDWLNLLGVLAIPVVAGLGVAWFTHVQQRRDQHIADQRAESEQKERAERAKLELEKALDNQREAALEGYIDKMSELLLKENLRGSSPHDGVRIVARARTLHVLRRLDGERKGSVIQFLSESHLLSLVDLSYADLSHANLFKANLIHATLFRANLHQANLFQATLDSVNLSEAYMPEVDLRGANLHRANLSGAHICFADLRGANLTSAILENKTTGMKVKLVGTKYNKKPLFLQYELLTEGINLNPTRWSDDFGHETADAAEAMCVDC